jgi:hypothetical protein
MNARYLPKMEGLVAPVMKGLGKGVNAVGEFLAPKTDVAIPAGQKLASEILSPLTHVGPEELQQVMANAGAVSNAPSYPVLAKKVAGTMGKLGDKIGEAVNIADAALDAKKMVPTGPILDTMKASIDSITSNALPENKAARDVLTALVEEFKVKHPNGVIPETELVAWMKDTLGAAINPNNPGGVALSSKLNTIKGILNRAVKEANPRYGELEKKAADLIDIRDSIGDLMGLQKKWGKDWEIKNVATTKLRSLLSPDNVAATKEVLDRLSGIPGMDDFVKAVKLTAAKEAISARAPMGYRLATLGLGSKLPALGGVLAGLVPSVPEIATNVATKATQAAIPAVNAIYQGLRD